MSYTAPILADGAHHKKHHSPTHPILQYKRERNLSGVCHEPKWSYLFQRALSDNGAFVCLAANLAHGQRLDWHL